MTIVVDGNALIHGQVIFSVASQFLSVLIFPAKILRFVV